MVLVEIVLTVVVPGGSPESTDLAVSAPPGTRFGDLRDRLLQACGAPPHADLFCGDSRVGDDSRVGAPPLTDGAELCAGRVGASRRRGLLELHVRSGPDSGSVHRLGPGEHTVGRSALAAIPVDDPDVSRVHAVLTIGAGGGPGALVADAGSTNGTRVDGSLVDSAGSEVRPGQVVAIGSSTLVLCDPTPEIASCRPDGAGAVLVNRPPRHLPPEEVHHLRLPDRSAPAEPRAGLPLLALAVPLLLGALLAVVSGSATYLLFALMSPLMLVGSHVADRLSGRRDRRAAATRYATALAAVRASAAAALSTEFRVRHERSPDAATLLAVVSAPGPRLWERTTADRDFLELRLGLGDLPSRLELRSSATVGLPDSVERPQVKEVPVTVSLRVAGVVGVCGDPFGALRLGRFLVAQVAGWHSPAVIRVAALVDDLDEWSWIRWLPHARLAAGFVAVAPAKDAQRSRRLIDWLVEELGERQADAATGRSRGHRDVVVTVLAGAEALRRRPGVARLLTEGPSAGLFFICLERSRQQLPHECRATVDVNGDVGTALRLVLANGWSADGVVLDGVSRRWAERFARALAPLRDATPDHDEAGLPVTARLLDLLGLPDCEASALVRAWAHPAPGLAVPLGVGPNGEPVVVDLATDGPHLLVAGTTGAGKSELLQSLIAGLAVRTPPHLLSFLLVDYKGGAAFARCAHLPHSAGLVTDLDGALTERALASLTAELRRRERVLRDSGCPDVDTYNAVSRTGREPLARLVLVVDEFATLADELPEFLGGLVSIAQRGRALGVHLVLATQRPGGAVSADIRANVSLRIALRVSDPSESTDIVDVTDAAFLPRHLPGRAVIRAGTGSVGTMQTARVTGPGQRRTEPTGTVRRWAWDSSEPAAGPDPAELGPSDLDLVVTACREAVARLGVVPAPSPWLPPLPALLPVDDERLSAGDGLAIGLVDRPAEQRTEAFRLFLDRGEHLLVVGGPRSGRTTALRTVAGQLLRTCPEQAHLYVLDGGGRLGQLTSAPGCGAVIGREQVDRGSRLIQLLEQELERRRQLLADHGLGDVADLPAERRPLAVMVLVDGWEAVQDAYEEVDHGRPLDTLVRLVRDGGNVGISFAVTGGRGLLTNRVAGSFRRRVVLPLPDPADYAAAGLATRHPPADQSPGRGVLLPAGEHVQLAVLGVDATGAAQDQVLGEIVRGACARAVSGRTPAPLRVEPLPSRVRLVDIRADAKAASPGRGWALFGVGGDDARPVGVDLQRDGPWVLVTGRPGSGRSTALLTATSWLLAEGREIVIVARPRSPLHVLADLPRVWTLAPDRGDLRQVLDHAAAAVVVIDDAEDLRDTAVERAVIDVARADEDQRLGFLIGCALTEVVTGFRGLAVEARRGRTGLLLGNPGAGDGEAFGLRLPRSAGAPAGRGLLVTRGVAAPLQVAVPEIVDGYR